jgi:hypothetical protein
MTRISSNLSIMQSNDDNLILQRVFKKFHQWNIEKRTGLSNWITTQFMLETLKLWTMNTWEDGNPYAMHVCRHYIHQYNCIVDHRPNINVHKANICSMHVMVQHLMKEIHNVVQVSKLHNETFYIFQMKGTWQHWHIFGKLTTIYLQWVVKCSSMTRIKKYGIVKRAKR